MPAIINWLLRLLPTNPICMRLVQGGSRRMRHLYIRAGYLGLMIMVLLFVLIGSVGGGSLSMRELAGAGATMFEWVSYLQVGLICLLTPVFMAGAIAQEANPSTWDIMLTSPLNNLQIVLGNLFGRLFFVLALLVSSLPLFVVTQYFGGVPGDSIFASYAIAGTSALLVAAIAVTLSVTRTAGRRAVFIFYISVVMYLFVTYAIDVQFRAPVAAGTGAFYTTVMTPLNPFLALDVLLHSNTYVPHDLTGQDVTWFTRMWLSEPIKAFCWTCGLISLVLVMFSTVRLRVIGARTGQTPWYRKMFGLAAKGAMERPPRSMGNNPISWRESTARGKTLAAMVGRWGFVAAGVLLGLILIVLFHTGTFALADLKLAVATLVSAELVVIALAALNMSATAVSREREDGTLDIILTTPIQPGPYISGKLRGLVQYLVPMMAVPVITVAMVAIYVLADGFGRTGGVTLATAIPGTTATVNVPAVMPGGALALLFMLPPFVAFCVMVGLHWSIRSKGTISSVIAAVGIVLAVVGVISLCGMAGGSNLNVVGGVLNAFSPVNLLFAIVYPADLISDAVKNGVGAATVSLVIGSLIAAVIYSALVYAMHANMKRTFMMTVRRLAGTSG